MFVQKGVKQLEDKITTQNTQLTLPDAVNLIPKVLWGLFLAALGTVMMLHAKIGLFPWGTLNAGLTKATGISFGTWSQIIGLALVLIMAMFKYYPGIGTLLDTIFFGFFVDMIQDAKVIMYPKTLMGQTYFALLGLVLMSYGMSLYMSCGLGAGPRDGLMLFLMKLTGRSVTFIKTSIEITVTALGLLLGGPFGFGTIMLALLGGKVLQLMFKWTQFDAGTLKQHDLFELFDKTKNAN